MGHLHYCLGIEFMQNKDNIVITQKKYIDGIHYKFKMLDLKLISTPLDNYVKRSKDICSETEQEKSEIKKHSLSSIICTINVFI